MTRLERIGWLEKARQHVDDAIRAVSLAWGDSQEERAADGLAIVRIADASSLMDRAKTKLRIAVETLQRGTRA